MYKTHPTSSQVRWSVHNSTIRHTVNTHICPRITVTAHTVTQSASDGTGRHSPNAIVGQSHCCVLPNVAAACPTLQVCWPASSSFAAPPLRPIPLRVRMSDTAHSQPWTPPGRGSDRAKSGGGRDTWLRNQMLCPRRTVRHSPGSQTQEAAYTTKIKDYNSHQTTNICPLHCGRWAH